MAFHCLVCRQQTPYLGFLRCMAVFLAALGNWEPDSSCHILGGAALEEHCPDLGMHKERGRASLSVCPVRGMTKVPWRSVYLGI